VSTAGIRVLCQLECEGEFRAEVLKWIPGYFDPAPADPGDAVESLATADAAGTAGDAAAAADPAGTADAAAAVGDAGADRSGYRA